MKRDNQTIINKLPSAVKAIVDKQILDGFRRLRNSALTYAQSSHEFKNQTNNLEDSYAAAIYYDGAIIEKTISGKTATEPRTYRGADWFGHEAAGKFLDEFDAGSGYTLIIVAGQFYAAWVEAKHGLDVLTGAYQLTKEEMQSVWRQMPTAFINRDV